MPSSEREQPLDLWAEQHGEVAVLVGQLQPGEALEILRRVVIECTEGRQVVPMLLGPFVASWNGARAKRTMVDRTATPPAEARGSDLTSGSCIRSSWCRAACQSGARR